MLPKPWAESASWGHHNHTPLCCPSASHSLVDCFLISQLLYNQMSSEQTGAIYTHAQDPDDSFQVASDLRGAIVIWSHQDQELSMCCPGIRTSKTMS